MTEKMLEKRAALKNMSNVAKIRADVEGITGSVNDLLMHYFYNKSGTLTFNSFKKWKENGFQVKKGAKAFLLWAEPINKNADKPAGKKDTSDSTAEDLFFPLAFVFSSEQVEPVKK